MTVKIAFIDFDDTIFPYSHFVSLAKNNNTNIYTLILDEETKKFIDNIDSILLQVINELLEKKYKVVILSCANIFHVNECINKYFPKIKQIINKLIVITADNEYYSGNNISTYDYKFNWKYNKMYKFISTVSITDCQTDYNIISFGNSEYERGAILKISKQLKTPVKNIMFNGNILQTIPTSNNICTQWIYVLDKLILIINDTQDIDSMLIFSNPTHDSDCYSICDSTFD